MDDDRGPLLTIGELARRTGLPVRTIRYWSDIGAVPPSERGSGGHRLYDAEAVARLDLVRTLWRSWSRTRLSGSGCARVEYHAGGRAAAVPGAEAGARFAEKVTGLVGPVRERGVAPDSAEAKAVLDRVLEGADAARRGYIRERLRAGVDSQSDRYHELLAVINGELPRPSRAADLEWLIAAIDSNP